MDESNRKNQVFIGIFLHPNTVRLVMVGHIIIIFNVNVILCLMCKGVCEGS